MAEKKILAEIVSIGDEITSGAIVDTNSAFLSRELSDLGVRTLFHSTVGDQIDAMAEVFSAAVERSDLIIVTGGLGPTEDDLTRQAVARVAGVELVEDAASREHIRRLFNIRKRPMPDSNIIQAFFPAGSRIIENQNGTAPGFAIDLTRKSGGGKATLLTFPGVPAEMKEMWSQSGRALVENFIVERFGARRHIQSRSIHCFGAGESDIESRLPHLIDRKHIPRVGITASAGIITLRVTAEGTDYAECRRQLDETAETIYANVGEFVFGEGNQTLASVLADRLLEQKKRLGVVEWGTGGFLCKKIDRRVFAGGLVDTVERPAAKLLGLPADASPEQILRTFSERIGADCVIAVGPYPSAEELETPEKTAVFVCALCGGRFVSTSFVYGLHPSIIDNLFSDRAINQLRKILLS